MSILIIPFRTIISWLQVVALVVVELSFAVSAGILTAFSPCGVPFLPGLVSYYLKDENRQLQGGVGSAVFALGLLILLLPLVVLAVLATSLLADYTAHLVLAGGLITLALAVGMWKGIYLFPRFGVRVKGETSGYKPLFAMGFAYIGASVGCTPALFFGVTATAVATASLGDSTLILLAFVISVVVPTLLLSLLTSEYRLTYAKRIKRLITPIKKVSVALTFGMGFYLIIFYLLYVFLEVPV